MVRGGGENRRKTAIAFALSFIIAFMLAQPVSAGTKTFVVLDRTGDLAKFYYLDTGEPRNGWGDQAPMVRAGCFDITSIGIAQKDKMYTFGMALAGALPKEGDVLPAGVTSAWWDLYIEAAPFDPSDPAPFLFIVRLLNVGSSYTASLMDIGAGVTTPLALTIDGPTFEIKFSADSVGKLSGCWVSFGVMVLWGHGGDWNAWNVDNPDPGAVPGFWDFPWPYA